MSEEIKHNIKHNDKALRKQLADLTQRINALQQALDSNELGGYVVSEWCEGDVSRRVTSISTAISKSLVLREALYIMDMEGNE